MALTPNMTNEVANHQDSHHSFYTYNASQPSESLYNWIVYGENLIELCSFVFFFFFFLIFNASIYYLSKKESSALQGKRQR